MADDDLKPNSSTSDEDDQGNNDVLEDFEEEFEEDGVTPKKPNKKSAAARINELSGKVKSYEEKIAELEKKVSTPPPPPPPAPQKEGQLSTEQQKAVEYLEGLGFTRKEAVESKLKEIEDRRALDVEHSRLHSNYSGEDGRPKYDQAKVEQFMRDHAVYDPEIAYKAMNEAELLDWQMKKTSSGETGKRPFIEKPSGGGVNRSSEHQITRDKLAEVSKNPSPANRAWYERNRNKILQLLAEGQL